MGSGQNPALERWRSRAVHDVTLPSGMRAQVRVPAAEKLATDSRVPARLRMRALQFSTSIIRTNELDEEGLTEMLQLQAHLTAMAVVGLWVDDHFEPVTLTPDEVWALELPSEDLDALESIALRRATPAQVTAGAQAAQGLLPPEVAEQVAEQEAAGTVDAFAPFRVEPRGADNSADSPAVQHPPEPDDRDTRPSSGVGG